MKLSRISPVTRVAAIITAATLMIAAIVVAGCSATQRTTADGSTSDSASSRSKPPVAKAPDFNVKSIDGTTISLSDYAGKPMVINFAASWCGPCQLEAPILAKSYEKYKDRVVFIGIAVRDNEDSQRAFAQKHGLTFPIGLDPSGDIIYSYQKAGRVSMTGIPTTFFIKSDGTISTFWVGPLSETTFDRMVNTILQ